MPIDLSEYETGAPFDGDYGDALKKLQKRLARIQARHIVHDARSMLVFQGWDAAGKGGAIRRLTAELDPRYYAVHSIGAPTEEAKARHFLWRFWKRLPGARDIAIFDRSWYGRVLVERVEGFATEAEWRRGYDEINEFEAQQIDSGTTVLKLFFHVTQAEQDRRFADRLNEPHKRWKLTREDLRNRAKRGEYLDAISAMFAGTDTRWAPWTVIDGNDKKAARIAALTHIADALDSAVPDALPDVDPKLAKLARKAFGYDG